MIIQKFKKTLKELFEVNLTISIGFGQSPFEANLKAYDAKQNNIILNEEYNIFGFIDNQSELNVSIMHFDIDDLKSKKKRIIPHMKFQFKKFFRNLIIYKKIKT